MSTRTLARAGASLLDRLLIANPSKQIGVSVLPRVASSTPFKCFPAEPLAARLPPPEAAGEGKGDTDVLKFLASSQEVFFPCGLPSLRFFIDEGNDDLMKEPMHLLPKRTYQPSTIRRKRNHGYLARKATKGGRKVIARRVAKGRARIAV
ncbi:hypothetical protein Cni_G08571 [Canna indica]|uniref:Large ribosomal subunit protein bL34m n=1 Tax=Canna indica TaxID=4628 RepID=A0AAQ3K0N0_9LILI|nr:hypothetical protein Cni_G08571 [Canna indica]